jgi:hypothetical protein
MRLKVGQGYFSFPDTDPALIQVPWTEANQRKALNQGFILRDGLDLDIAEQKSAAITEIAAEALSTPPPEELKRRVLESRAAQQALDRADGIDNSDSLLDGVML